MKGRWIFKMVVGGALIIAALTAVVMWLWNMLIPELFHGPIISFWQALGLLVLSKILFKGGHGWRARGGWNNHHWRQHWQKMTPDERQKMQEQWKQRCSMWKSKRSAPDASAT